MTFALSARQATRTKGFIISYRLMYLVKDDEFIKLFTISERPSP